MSLKIQKKKTWSAFSLMIRLRDVYEYKQKNPEVNGLSCKCVTCGRLYNYKSLQAGHFVPGRTNSILFDERGVHSQCYGCNVGRNGCLIDYYPFMQEKYGEEVIDELRRKKNETVKFTIEELKEMELDFNRRSEEYLDKINNL